MNVERILSYLLVYCGVIHLLNVPALAAAPRLLEWREPTERAAKGAAWLRVQSVALGIVIVGLGAVVIVHAREIAYGGTFSASITAVLSLFWAYRTLVHVRLYARSGDEAGYRIHWLLGTLFAVVSASYFAVSWHAYVAHPM